MHDSRDTAEAGAVGRRRGRTVSTSRSASIRQLHAAIDVLAPTVSAARLRQLRMVGGMFERSIGRAEMPVRASRTAPQLFTWAALGPFWELAAAGELRAMPAKVGQPLTLADLRVVRDCLKILAGAVVPDKAVRLPVVSGQGAAPAVSDFEAAVLYRRMADQAGAAGLGQAEVRALAVQGVVLDSGARAGELAAMLVDEVGPGEESVVVRRRPQNASHLPELPAETVLLRLGTRAALRRWLRVRAEVVSALEGSPPRALWVSLRSAPLWRGGVLEVRPPGMPLRPQGLIRGHHAAMVRVNEEMAGRWVPDPQAEGGGRVWAPLPVRLEQLRRALREESEE